MKNTIKYLFPFSGFPEKDQIFIGLIERANGDRCKIVCKRNGDDQIIYLDNHGAWCILSDIEGSHFVEWDYQLSWM